MSVKRTIKGIRIRILNQVMLVISIILFIVAITATVQIWHDYTASLSAIDNYIKWDESANGMRSGSDTLTKNAQLYVQLLRKDFADNYFKELNKNRSRERSIEFVSKTESPEDHEYLDRALAYSNDLAQKEIYAIRLIAEAVGHNPASISQTVENVILSQEDQNKSTSEKIETARIIMFGDGYQEAKKKIIDLLEYVFTKNIHLAREKQAEALQKLGKVIRNQQITLFAICLVNILIFSMIIILIINPLQVYLNCIKNDKKIELVGAYEFKQLALTYNDIFAIKEHQDRMLKHQAEHDVLTGLLNRAAYISIQSLLTSNPQPIALVLMDVDKFKDINDTYGHEMGDRILRRVAELMLHSFRSNDFCIRMGGDEFAIIVTNASKKLEKVIYEKITSINDALQNPDDDLPATSLSVGVVISEEGFTADLFANADKTLYEVKKSGRCGCHFYNNNGNSTSKKNSAT